MKRWLAIAALVTVPLQALGDTAAGTCNAAVTFAGSLHSGLAGLRATPAQVGWCAVENAEMTAYGIAIAGAAFRVDQWPLAPASVRSVEISVDRLETGLGSFTLSVALTHEAESGALTLHELSLRGDDGRRLKAVAKLSSGPFEGAASPASILTDLKVEGFLAHVSVTPAFLRETGISFGDLTRANVNEVLRDIDEAQVTRRTRSEFLRFAGAAPDAQGSLEVRLETADGVPVGQLVGPVLGLGRSPETQAIARVLEAALAGVSIEIVWNPGRM